MAYTYRYGDKPLADYTVQRAVGRGGFGEVYYAVSDGGREVALKYLRDNPQVELRGVANCINLKSPNLVSVFDVTKNDQGEYFVIMEYISGPSLRDIIVAEPNGIGVQKAAYLFREACKGLAYLHDRGIVHRDIKPGNIFYDEGYTKIGDYGLSKFISISRHSAQTSSVGTVHYMAPEVGSGDYSKAIDIYAMGVILYEMLTGDVPFGGSSMGEVLMKHLTTTPDVSELPAPFDRIVSKAMAKDPKDRYQSVQEMMAEVEVDQGLQESLVGFNPSSLSQAARNPVDEPKPRQVQDPRPRPVDYRQAGAGQAYRYGGAGAAVAVHPQQRIGQGSAWNRHHELCEEAASGRVEYAGFWIRVVAAIIDGLIVGIPTAAAGPFISGVLGIVYSALLIGHWNGQTLGKKALGIKVISNDGRPCGVGQAFARSAAKILSMLTFMIGYLIVGFDSRKRGLHDHVAGTLHIYAAR